MFGKLSLLFEGDFADLTLIRSHFRMDSEMIFHVAVLVKFFIACGAVICGIISLCVRIEDFLNQVGSFLTNNLNRWEYILIGGVVNILILHLKRRTP
jgi:hypothetical protein